MWHRFRLPAVLAAGAMTAAALAAAGPAGAARDPAVNVALTRPAAAAAQARTLWLPSGTAITVSAGGAAAVLPGGGALSGSVLSLTAGRASYEVPLDALPYLNHGLDPALFETKSLLAEEKAGRLPVRVGYTGRLPALPGVTITSSGDGTADGYLTVGSARVFGSALARQYLADRPGASYGSDGIFRGHVSVSLAGTAPATVRAAGVRPGFVMHTLTVAGTSLSGKPDTGDTVYLLNVDNGAITGNPFYTGSAFYHGVAKFSVPAGHYFALADFLDLSRTGTLVAERAVTLPQFTVSGDATVHMDERAANSEVRLVTPRPAVRVASELQIDRVAASGLLDSFGFFDQAPVTAWVAPAGNPVKTGQLRTFLDAWLTSPSSAAAPYEYDLAYSGPSGVIPPQRYVVNPASLATVDARYFSAVPMPAYLARLSFFPFQARYIAPDVQNDQILEPWIPVRLPQDRTEYTTASPSLAWTSLLADSGPSMGDYLQDDAFRFYRPGERVTEDWSGYPLHPGVNVDLTGGYSALGDTTPSATRAGDQEIVVVSPFTDNVPGHSGPGYDPYPPGTAVSGTYEIDQNGTRLAGGNVVSGIGAFVAGVNLSPDPSTVTFTLAASRTGPDFPLSTRTQTTWTWRSSHESGQTPPAGWTCPDGSSGCRVEPMVTLEYNVGHLALDGTAPAGQQSLGITAGHLQLAAAAKVTDVTAQVSFDDGKTWQAAKVSGTNGSYLASYDAPAGSFVTTRVTATDAVGGQISETITRAYRTGAAGAGGTAGPVGTASATAGYQAACPAAQPGHVRCFALYRRQPAANRALETGQAIAPTEWGAGDIESAYKLPVTRDPHQTVAIVDVGNTPGLASDIAAYRQQYGLPACTTASDCLRIVNQNGKSAPLPPSGLGTGWDLETTLDAEMVSAACPQCRILVVEANGTAVSDPAVAEDTAVRLGANVVSNSYGARETGFTQALGKAFDHPGHVIVASSGDDGFFPAQFPANLASVTAVGGTELAKAANSRGWTETVWNKSGGASGSACSAYVPKPAWQHDTHCRMRTAADVAAVADNVAVYDAYYGGWLTGAGTSAAAPLIAGVYALAGNAATAAPGYPYRHAGALFDVTSGNNNPASGGTSTGGALCGYDYLCVAGPGYDAPTGLGTPDGTGGF